MDKKTGHEYKEGLEFILVAMLHSCLKQNAEDQTQWRSFRKSERYILMTQVWDHALCDKKILLFLLWTCRHLINKSEFSLLPRFLFLFICGHSCWFVLTLNKPLGRQNDPILSTFSVVTNIYLNISNYPTP